jgi:hypothetical protein
MAPIIFPPGLPVYLHFVMGEFDVHSGKEQMQQKLHQFFTSWPAP